MSPAQIGMARRTAAMLIVMTLLRMIGVAHAVGSVDVRIREAVLDPGGNVRLTVAVAGASRDLAASDFAVTEQGVAVPNLTVTPMAAAAQPVAVALAMDVSGSTAGRPLADAKSAAKAFVGGLPAYVRVGLVTFGPGVRLTVPFTTDRARVARAVEALSASGGTALYDAVKLAATTLGRTQAQRNIVVFSDGKDTASRVDLAAAVAAARTAHAPVTTIGLEGGDLDAAALGSLASRTGGRAVRVGQSGGLTSAFRNAARDIASQYVLNYGGVEGPADLAIVVTVAMDGARASDRMTALNPRTAGRAPGPRAYAIPGPPLIPALASSTGRTIGMWAAFVALLLFFGLLLARPRRTEVEAFLLRGLRVYTRSAGRTARANGKGETGAFARAAAGVLRRLPKSSRREEKVQAQIDRAGWPFRASEFLAIRAAASVAGGVLGFGLFGRWWLGLLLAAVGPWIPKMLLTRRIASRQAAVLGQLPDTLQLLAGSLQAGYGFMQAIDTLVKESPEPTSTEFSRVLTETRLGMPIEDALNTMADRLGSEDFRWVVLAINIQRQVGGNLAVLLRTVAETLRDRERVRRQISVLSAEGKLSAYILGTLPFGIAGYIAVVNPSFLATMTDEPMGRAMIGGALVMLGLGIVWMRKIIRIEV
ncbi:MAG: VWA domain-containing protein [Actinomycetota bacterium]